MNEGTRWECEPCGTINPGGAMCANCHGTLGSARCQNGVPADAVLRPDVCRDCAVGAKCVWPGEENAPVRACAPECSEPTHQHDHIDHRSAPRAAGVGPHNDGGFLGPSGFPVPPDIADALKKAFDEGRTIIRGRPVILESHIGEGAPGWRAGVAEATDDDVGPSGLTQSAIKKDDGKIDWTYLPFDALEEIVKVLAWAAEGPSAKYARESWRELRDDPTKGPVDVRAVKSALRHILADTNFHQRYDDETGLQHIAHAATQLLFAIAHRRMKEAK